MTVVWPLCPLDLGCHCHEGLLNVCCILSTGFQKRNRKLISKFLQNGVWFEILIHDHWYHYVPHNHLTTVYKIKHVVTGVCNLNSSLR